MVQTVIGGTKTLPLKPGGENIPVTNENRKGTVFHIVSKCYVLS